MARLANNGHHGRELVLGRRAAYPERYDPEVLQGLPRARRAWLGKRPEPFRGMDRWVAWEASWLNQRGRPMVGVAVLEIPADSPQLVESKSLKLFLNSLNTSRFERVEDYAQVVERDVGATVGAPVAVQMLRVDDARTLGVAVKAGFDLDVLDVDPGRWACDRDQLRCDADEPVTETLYSHLLRCQCPVTGQPDWGTLVVDYTGQPIHRSTLLRYIISWRDHCGFHEETVERMFVDILDRCAPTDLTVSGHFLRRGGIDITPVRSTAIVPRDFQRWPRQ